MQKEDKKEHIVNWITYILFFVFILLTIRYQVKLLNYIEWGDESETVVVAKMLAAGMELYQDIFNQHGPLAFLPGYLLESVGDFGIAGHRIFIAILQLISLASIYYSPLIKKKFISNIYTSIAATIMVVYLPGNYGHMYMYQTVAGLFFVIIFSQYSLPSIIEPQRVTRKQVAIGNFLLFSVPFLGITYLPATILIFIASCRKSKLRLSLLYAFLGIVFNFVVLSFLGSVKGYIAYHLYLNFKILPLYSEWLTTAKMVHVAFLSMTRDIYSFYVFIGLILAFFSLSYHENNKIPYKTICISLAIGSFLTRGWNFQGLPFYYIYITLPLTCLSFHIKSKAQSLFFIFTLQIICLVKLTLLVPGDADAIENRSIPTSTNFSKLVKRITTKDDKIIAYTFRNFEYIVSGRLPASGNFFYLPWQEKYNASPKYGMLIDACEDIKQYMPKVMLIDKWKVGNKYSWESYGQCIQNILNDSYYHLPDHPFYIRKDVAIENDFINK